jgi:uncharacterized protein (DUF1778 family)
VAAKPKTTELLHVRIPNKHRRVIERAAELRGTTLVDFVFESAYRAALIVVRENDTLRLRDEAKNVFVEAILNPPEPSQPAKSAVARYQTLSKG